MLGLMLGEKRISKLICQHVQMPRKVSWAANELGFVWGGSEAISKKLIDGDGRRVFKVQRGFLLVARYTPISFVWDTN
jgi:hypothetical protein